MSLLKCPTAADVHIITKKLYMQIDIVDEVMNPTVTSDRENNLHLTQTTPFYLLKNNGIERYIYI